MFYIWSGVPLVSRTNEKIRHNFFPSEKGQTHNFYGIFFNPFFTFENSLTVPQSSRFTTLS